MKNIRLKLACFIITQAIKLMPKDWQTKRALKNLIAVGAIEISEE